MEEKKIYKAIIAVMGEMSAIGKERKNQQQGFMYRGVEDVMNTLQPLFKKHGVFIVPEVIEHTREERQTKSGGNLIYSIMKIRHRFIAEDGSEVVSTTIGEGMDSADKSSNKAMAIAFKYACFQVFCIPTEDMPDPDSETPPENSPMEGNKQPRTDGKKPPKTDDKPKVVQTITRSELVQKYGVSNPEKTMVGLEGYFGKSIENFTAEETAEARQILDEKKRQRDEEKRKSALGKMSDDDVPFPLGDE
jgi:hypothetical protein